MPEELSQRLHRMHEELEGKSGVDDATRDALEELLADAQRLLNKPAPPNASAIERLDDTALQIEADHPSLALAINRLAEMLATLGI